MLMVGQGKNTRKHPDVACVVCERVKNRLEEIITQKS